MSFRLKRMKRTIFLSLLSFVFTIFLLLNFMMVQLNSSVSSKAESAVFPKDKKVMVSNFGISNIYKAQIQRKPKTANVDELDEESRENIHMPNNEVQNEGRSAEDKNTDKAVEEMEIIDYKDEDEDYSDENEDEDDDVDDYDYDDNNETDQKNINEQHYNLKTNPVFKSGDFGDIRGLEYYRKPTLKVQEIPREPKPTEVPTLIENDIYWSTYMESQIPKGLSYTNVTKLIREIRSTSVRSLQLPRWNRCGRAKNAYVTLVNNASLCARYRHPHYPFVFGEVLSFYLSRLLGMDNVPVVVLATTNSTSPQWRVTNFTKVEWENNITVALIQWIDHLDSRFSSKAVMPDLILKAYRTGKPIRAEDIYRLGHQNTSSAYIPDIVQWGTMFIFDYLTGNYDRVASMQDAAEKESKPSIMEETIRNLKKSSADGKLWLVDNESGLFFAYELLINRKEEYTTSRFTEFHRQTLQTMCVFQAHIVRALKRLYRAPSPHERLVNFAVSLEPLLRHMPRNDIHYERFSKIFIKRVKEVLDWVDKCESYSNKER